MAITLIKSGKKKGHYRVRIQPVDKLTGKKISIPSEVTKSTDKLEAFKIQSEMWSRFNSTMDKVNHVLDQPFADVLSSYIERCYKNGKWEISTYNDWKYTSKLVKAFFNNQKLKDVREDNIRIFAHDYVKKHHTIVGRNTTVDRQLQHLRSFFDYMKRYGLSYNPVPKSPLKEFFRKSEMTLPAKVYTFSSNEISLLKQEIRTELEKTTFIYWCSRLAILLALDTGMRPQEIQAIQWNEFVEDHGHTVLKIDDSWSERKDGLNGHLKSRMRGESRLTLPLSATTTKLLKEFHEKQLLLLNRKGIINRNQFVFLNLTDYARCAAGKPIAQRTMNDMIKRLCKKVHVENGQLRVSMYTCRHTVATKLGNNPNMDYVWAADRLGHSFDMFLHTYVHPDKDKDEEMLNMIVSAQTQ